MALCVVVLDMRELGRVFEGWDRPVEVTEPFVGVGVVGADGAEVGLVGGCISMSFKKDRKIEYRGEGRGGRGGGQIP